MSCNIKPQGRFQKLTDRSLKRSRNRHDNKVLSWKCFVEELPKVI